MIAQFGAHQLTGSLESESCGLITIDGQGASQAAEYIRGAWAEEFARGNKREIRSFKVVREFANELRAAEYAHGLRKSLPIEAALMLAEETGDGVITITWDSAILRAVTPLRYGRSVESHFAFSVGEPVISVSENLSMGSLGNWEDWDAANWEGLNTANWELAGA
jgi:hypothetical protein